MAPTPPFGERPAPARLRIVRVKVTGTTETNCYLVACARTREAVVIDPGADAAKVLGQCEGLAVRHVLCTHGHRNHVGAKEAVRSATGAATAMAFADAKQYLRAADQYVADGDRLAFGDFEAVVLATPGHSPGSLCFRVGNHLFTGDTLFQGHMGRPDLPDVDPRRQLISVVSRLLPLAPNTVVYPGHGPTSTIGAERRDNVAARAMA
ncbi:MAG TPA: MBL fold metallo-hydrolase [Candidatus Micrarchaeia archaeon]|nr:MBL fold metallo-hydrolase [Candidatus Micrarchaeia archaeon]